MTEPGWTEIESKHAVLVSEYVDLSEEARALLAEDATSEEYYAVLRREGLAIDAIRFLAAVLPARGAVHWALLSVRRHGGKDLPPADEEALRLAEEWLRQPREKTRYAAFAAAESQGMDSPAAWTAISAHWCGPSLAPPEAPVVPPAPGLPAKAASGALLLLSVVDPKAIDKRHATFLDLGEQIARGEEPIPEAVALPPDSDENGEMPTSEKS